MKRKVIQQANQAFTITLPIDWVRKNNIKKNSEVDVNISEKSLVINSDNPIAGGEVKMDVKGFSKSDIYRYVSALYSKGIDEIELSCDDDISSELMWITRNLNGYALVLQSKGKYVIKDLNSGSYPNLDEIFKRVFQMLLGYYEAAIEDIFGKESETLETLKNRDLEVNKFCLFLQRSINKSAYPNSLNGRILFTYSFALEKIGDEIERLWRTNIKHKPKKTNHIKEMTKLSSEGLGMAFDLYYMFSREKFKEIYAIRDKVREKSDSLKGLDASTMRFVRHLIKIIEDAADLNHLALMRRL